MRLISRVSTLFLPVSLLLAGCSGFGQEIDLGLVESELRVWASDFAEGRVSADCGDRSIPVEAGYSFICTLTDNTGSVSVRVTVLNADGDVEWIVLG